MVISSPVLINSFDMQNEGHLVKNAATMILFAYSIKIRFFCVYLMQLFLVC